MGKLNNNQIMGIVLLVALALLYVPVPFIDERSIATVALLVCGILLLVKK